MRGSIIRIGIAVCAIGFVAACGGKSPDEDEFGSGRPGGNSEFDEGLSSSGTGGLDGAAGTSGGLVAVYFDYDRWDIGSQAATKLRDNAQTIDTNSYADITVEGHCDERGSEEYNLALGEKRANAVKKYLVNLGIPSSNLTTVSYGESQSAVQGHDETAWQYNRRAEFRVIR